MSIAVRKASSAVIAALTLLPCGTAIAQRADTPFGPSERIHPIAGEVAAAPAVATTPHGHQLVAYLAATPEGVALLAKIKPSPDGIAWPNPLVITRHEWLGPPAVSVTKYGDFLAAWERGTPTGETEGVFARFYDRRGQPRGPEFKVNTTAGSDHDSIAVASNELGTRHLVAWTSRTSQADASVSVRAQLFDAAMQRIGPELRIDTTGADVAAPIAVAMPKRNATGPAYIVWTGNAPTNPTFPGTIHLRTIGDNGVLGAPVVVSGQWSYNGSAFFNYGAAVATSWDTTVAVAWKSQTSGTDGSRTSQIHSQRFNANLQPMSYATAVSERVPFSMGVSNPIVSMDFEGAQWVGWESRLFDLAPSSLKGRVLSLVGPSQAEFVVQDSVAGSDNALARMASDTDGATIFSWTQLLPDGGVDALQRRYRGHYLSYHPVTEALAVSSPVDHGDSARFLLRVPRWETISSAEGYVTVTGLRLDVELPPGAEVLRAGEGPWICQGVSSLSCEYDDILLVNSTTPYFPIELRAPATSGPLQLRATASADQAEVTSSVVATIQVADLTPDTPVFARVEGVPRGSVQLSNPASITGLELPVAISVTGGEYSLNAGAFTAAAGQVAPGDSVRVRHTAATAFSTEVSTVLHLGGVDATFASATEAADTTPESFALGARQGVTRGSEQLSDQIVVAGINTASPISVSGGSYSIDQGEFVSTAGEVAAGQRVRVRHVSDSQFDTQTVTTLDIGGVVGSFTSVTEAEDTLPQAFSFAARDSVPVASEQTSAEVLIEGINAPAAISVAGGTYSIGGGAFTANAGQVNAGQSVRVRHTASNQFATTTTTTLDVGGHTAVFASTTEPRDDTPNAFGFLDQSAVATGATITSAAVPILGVNVPAPISVAGGSYSINGAAFTASAGLVNQGDQVRVQHVSSNAASSAVHTTLTVGGVSDTFTSTTGTLDTTPAAFAFVDVTGAKRNKAVVSAAMTIAGINTDTPISIAGGGAAYSKNGGAYTTAPGTVRNGDRITLRLTSSATSYTAVTTTLTVGGIADSWTVTTGH